MKKFVSFISTILGVLIILSQVSYAEDSLTLDELSKIAKKNIKKIERAEQQKIKEHKTAKTRTVQAQYLGTVTQEQYPSEERGPTTITLLDPYHPRHKDMQVPYYKDREGLKIHPLVGIRGEYEYDEQLVGIESLILEAKEFNQTTDSELRDYISTNDKHYTRGEIVLHYKENWPTFTYIYHAERVVRKYEAKKIWSPNDLIYDDRDKKYYKLEYTIPNLPKIGYLDLTARYGSVRNFEPNNNAGYQPYDSWLFSLKTMPFFDTKLKAELLYQDGSQPRYAAIDSWKKYELYLELTKYFPRKFLTIKPHYKWEDTEEFPVTSNSEWILHKAGLRLEKDINGNLGLMTDWTYLNYARDKNRELSNYQHISLKAITIENEITYKIIQDLKFTLGLDYAGGINFDGFNNYTIRGELSYRKPGLADYRIGLRHTEYYNIDENLNTLYFKIGLFI